MLSDRDRAILAFEAAHSGSSGWKDGEILNRFDMKPVRYYAIVNAIIDDPAALAERPQDVYRLREMRDERVGARRAREFRAA